MIEVEVRSEWTDGSVTIHQSIRLQTDAGYSPDVVEDLTNRASPLWDSIAIGVSDDSEEV